MKEHTQSIISVFDKYAKQYAKRYSDMSKYTEMINCFVENCSTDSKVLDICCGPGNLLELILRNFPELSVTGIDLSPAMLEIARERFPYGHFYELDMRCVQELNFQFDRVCCSFGLPYLAIDELPFWLKSIKEKLASKGRIYLSTMIKLKPSSELVFANSGEGKGILTSYYSEDYLRKTLKDWGFTIEKEAFFETDATDIQDYAVVASKEDKKPQEKNV